MLKREIESTDRGIDGLVYELYGLSPAGIDIVEGKGQKHKVCPYNVKQKGGDEREEEIRIVEDAQAKMRAFIEQWKLSARQLKVEVYALYLAYHDPRVPWYGRVFVACVVAYAFSPIDLIPDFIPILGYVDDLILLPLGIKAALAMIPESVLAESREKAQQIIREGKPVNWIAAIGIIIIWIMFMAWVINLYSAMFKEI